MATFLDRWVGGRKDFQGDDAGDTSREHSFWHTDRRGDALTPGNYNFGPYIIPDVPVGNIEQIPNNFLAYTERLFRDCPAVFAVTDFRARVLSEARFLWRAYVKGRPGDLFSTPALAIFERPWLGGTTSALIAQMELDATIAGNSYHTLCDDAGRLGRAASGNPGCHIVRMRPDYVTIVVESDSGNPNDLDRRILAYVYYPRSPTLSGNVSTPVFLLPDEVSHYAPIPDPVANYRGMSWLTPCVRDVQGDLAMAEHKLSYFRNGTSPKLVASLSPDIPVEEFRKFVAAFKEQHQGVHNAYKTLFLGGGADLTVAGANLQQVDFALVQGLGEVRIAAAAGVPVAIAGLSAGLGGSSLNAGNINSLKRLCSDATLRPLWRAMAGALENLTFSIPGDSASQGGGAQLWYDDRDVAFLREDAMDDATTKSTQATTIRTLVDGGFEPDSIVLAMSNNDWSLLRHSGLYSVQLQPPGVGTNPHPAIEPGDLPTDPATPPAPVPAPAPAAP